ncbi:ETX/MTX2 family pore-forming toxin [Clostridium massiliamazoniense]|uniref:ETX/MTX2 family pore-forming toxin n=1 Tax=Clostridium massiliamazoniense TaxID=1347366 RepID=UPI00241C05FC|nr:ETX/MTX2 family pore-forming toxin [Clostridium massiliamazoniense]
MTEQTYTIPSQSIVVPPHSVMEVGIVFGNARKKGVVDLFLEFDGTDIFEGFVCCNNNNIQTLSDATMPLYLAG